MSSVETTGRASAEGLRPNLRAWLTHNQTTVAVAAVALLCYVATLIAVPNFANLHSLLLTLQLAAFLGVVAAGEQLVVLTGGIDLSIPGVIAVTAIVVSSITAAGTLPPAVAILVALLLATAIGAVNGVGVAWFRVPPLVMTLAVNGIVLGVMLVATGGTPNSGVPPFLTDLANRNLGGGLTGPVLVWVAVVAGAALLLGATRAGRYLYAVGTNAQVARLAGVPVPRVRLLAYTLSGLTAGITGLLLLGHTGSSYATMGDAYLLTAIAAVVLGGTSILGGVGSAVGAALGAFLLTVIDNLLTVLNLAPASRQMLQGAVLLLVVVLYTLRTRTRR